MENKYECEAIDSVMIYQLSLPLVEFDASGPRTGCPPYEMTFINRTLPDLLSLCKPGAYILVLGPSTPLSPVMGEMGVDLLAGSIVEDIPAVLAALSQGGNFRQIHKAGVRLITQLAS